jgi:murein DD-endopeptidase MepM/ murein hydrolase activator NlpD
MSSPFGERRSPGPRAVGFHNGIDLPAPAGGPVYAAASGQITTIHRRGPGGLELAITHKGPNGPYTTLYAHLGTIAPAFARGATEVAAGQRIAVVGRSGVTYGTHLYFELIVNGKPVDPVGPLAVRPCGER